MIPGKLEGFKEYKELIKKVRKGMEKEKKYEDLPTFDDLKDKILEALEKKIESGVIKEPVTVVAGFIDLPFYTKLGVPQVSQVWFGESIPLVMLVGKETGQLFLFPYLSLIND